MKFIFLHELKMLFS